MVETADSKIISLIPARSCLALKAFGSLKISICKLLFFNITAEGFSASPL